ncbi:MAG: exo-alpha-sialidase [Chloroflexi bacterium]|nr:exo-alpha-sialidase [Chloroflexota bacterium]
MLSFRAALWTVLLLCMPGWAAVAAAAPTEPTAAATASPTPVQTAPLGWADLPAQPEALRMRWSSDLLGRQIDVASAIPNLEIGAIVAPGAPRSPEPAGSPSTPTPVSVVTTPGQQSTDNATAFPDGSRIAYCGTQGIWRSLDGGSTWTLVPIDGVAATAARTPYPLAPRIFSAPACQAVTQDPLDPDTFYAVFTIVRPPQDAPPPLFFGGFVTRDAGQTWQAVPLPDDTSAPFFGGFFVLGNRVQALYGEGVFRPTPGPVAPPRVFETFDSGASWQPAGFDCPAAGPCVRWGAAPSGIGSCAMHGAAQRLLYSGDGGQTWAAPKGAPAVNACQPNQIVALSETDVLLLAPGGTELDPTAAPVRLSRDGGHTFVPLALPDSPDLREVVLLPAHQLLALTVEANASWLFLEPGAISWLPANATVLPNYRVPLGVAVDRLWWLSEEDAPISVPLSGSVPAP